MEALVRDLLLHDFSKLVTLLYRVDVSEKRLKALLAAEPQRDAAVIITHEIIRRQAEKIKTRQSFKGNSSEGDEERW